MTIGLIALLAQVPPAVANEASPWISGGATVVLAGVVVWLAKAYRDDMKERAAASLTSHEKVAVEFKKTSEETRDKFLSALEKKTDSLSKMAVSVDDLCDRIAGLACRGK